MKSQSLVVVSAGVEAGVGLKPGSDSGGMLLVEGKGIQVWPMVHPGLSTG